MQSKNVSTKDQFKSSSSRCVLNAHDQGPITDVITQQIGTKQRGLLTSLVPADCVQHKSLNQIVQYSHAFCMYKYRGRTQCNISQLCCLQETRDNLYRASITDSLFQHSLNSFTQQLLQILVNKGGSKIRLNSATGGENCQIN